MATCDRDLKRRLRKIPGVPIMYITQHRYSIERMPEAYGGRWPRFKQREDEVKLPTMSLFSLYSSKSMTTVGKSFSTLLECFLEVIYLTHSALFESIVCIQIIGISSSKLLSLSFSCPVQLSIACSRLISSCLQVTKFTLQSYL